MKSYDVVGCVVLDKKVMVNIRYSGIGNSFVRMFVEMGEGRYYNVDLSLDYVFKMKEEDFKDWEEEINNWEDCIEGGIDGLLKEYGYEVKWEVLFDLMSEKE